ncbi:hypothetical protein AB7M29_002841 [Pseudomonas sp. F-14 TE3623]
MEFLPVTPEQRELVSTPVMDAEQISGYAVSLVARIQEIFDHVNLKERLGVSATTDKDGVSADFETVFGRVRSALSFFTSEEGIQGRYIFEKEVKGPLGEPAWRVVWGLRITKDGLVFRGGKDAPIKARVSMRGRDDIEAYELALSLLHMIGADPK